MSKNPLVLLDKKYSFTIKVRHSSQPQDLKLSLTCFVVNSKLWPVMPKVHFF